MPTLRELYPRAGNIIVVDTEGWILCGAKPPPGGERLRVVDMELQRAVMRDGEFRLSQPLIGKISKTWGVTAVQPVRGDDGSVVGAVGMAIDLQQLQPFGRLRKQRRRRWNRRSPRHRDRALGRTGSNGSART